MLYFLFKTADAEFPHEFYPAEKLEDAKENARYYRDVAGYKGVRLTTTDDTDTLDWLADEWIKRFNPMMHPSSLKTAKAIQAYSNSLKAARLSEAISCPALNEPTNHAEYAINAMFGSIC